MTAREEIRLEERRIKAILSAAQTWAALDAQVEAGETDWWNSGYLQARRRLREAVAEWEASCQ